SRKFCHTRAGDEGFGNLNLPDLLQWPMLRLEQPMRHKQPPLSSPRNRRQSVREPAKGHAKIACRKGGLVGAFDISQTGVRIALNREPAVRQEVALTLESIDP